MCVDRCARWAGCCWHASLVNWCRRLLVFVGSRVVGGLDRGHPNSVKSVPPSPGGTMLIRKKSQKVQKNSQCPKVKIWSVCSPAISSWGLVRPLQRVFRLKSYTVPRWSHTKKGIKIIVEFWKPEKAESVLQTKYALSGLLNTSHHKPSINSTYS